MSTKSVPLNVGGVGESVSLAAPQSTILGTVPIVAKVAKTWMM